MNKIFLLTFGSQIFLFVVIGISHFRHSEVGFKQAAINEGKHGVKVLATVIPAMLFVFVLLGIGRVITFSLHFISPSLYAIYG